MRKKLLTLALATGLACFAFTGKAEAAGSGVADATPIVSEQPVSGNFGTNGRVNQFYKVSIPQSGRLNFSVTTKDDSANFEVMDAAQKVVYGAEYFGSQKQGAFIRKLVAGDYYIKVSGYGSKYNDNSYSFQFKYTPATETFPESYSTRDDADAAAHPMKFGTAYTGYLGSDDLVDAYKLTLSQDSVLFMNITGSMQSISFDFYGTNGVKAKSNYVTKDSGATSVGTKTLRAFSLKKGTYFLRVNTISGSDSYTGSYSFSIKRTNLGWNKDAKGWWYQYEDGTYAKSKQVKVGKKYYYFNAGGYMITGWKKIGRDWYYFDKKAGGAMATGWKKVGKKWYYFQKDYGNMYTGYRSIGNKWYYFNTSGEMRTGWLKPSGSTWHYFGSDGAERYGWQKIGGKWYYFGKSGNMYYGGRISINGRVYRFSDSGVCLNP